MAQYVNDPVPRYKREDLPGTTKKLRDYVVGLTDQLQYLLGNLDADNIPELDGIRKRLSDAEGNVASLTLTAQGLTLSVQDQNDRFAALSVSVEGIGTQVGNLEGSLSTVTQTVSGIETRVQSAEGSISSLTQTASSLSAKISTAEGNISSLTQTVTSLSSSLSTAEGNISSLTQTASGLTSRVSTAEGSISTLNQTASSLSSTVSGLDGKYTSLKQTVDSIDLTGMVTFSDLETEGESVINGANITTGDLNVATDGVGGVYFYNGKVKSANEIGRIEVYSSRYPDLFIETSNENNIRLVSGAHISMESGADCHIYIEGDDYVQIRAGGVNYYFRADGIYRGSTQIA